MEYTTLNHTDIYISRLCLGSMTWGEQNTEQQAHQQLDYAIERGINFVDTAELYPSPPKAGTYGKTEEIIGNWVAKGNRDKIILASKVCGPARSLPWIRDGKSYFSKQIITTALHGSLKRLKTDYIDIYQLHWPDRITNMFGQLAYPYKDDGQATPIINILQTLKDCIDEGKIRAIGLSNETPWGVMSFLHIAHTHQLPVAIAVQNPYNLLNRSYENNHSEISHRENIGLLAYSPLAFGILTGKYLYKKRPAGCRMTLFKHFQRYSSDAAINAVTQYQKLANQYQLSLTQLALRFIAQQPFVSSVILGATNIRQLEENINSLNTELPDQLLKKLDKIHIMHPNPCL